MTDPQTRLVVAAAVLVVGVVLAFAARTVVARMLGRRLPEADGRRQVRTAARGTFWFLIAITVIVSGSMLAPTLLAGVPAQLLAWLPRLGVALVILWFAAVAAALLRRLVTASLEDVGIAGAPSFGQAVYWLIIALAVVLAADQLGVDTTLLQRLLFVVLAVAGAGAALAIGLGGSRLLANVFAGRYVSDRFSEGQRIVVGETEGTLVEIGLASVTVRREDGSEVEIPHQVLLERPVQRHDPEGTPGA